MLEVPQVKVANRAVFPAGGKNMRVTKANIVDSRVVSDQLRRNGLLLDVPDRARRINRRGADD